MHLFSSISPQPLSHDSPELIRPVLPISPGPVVRRVRLQSIQFKQVPVDGHKTYKVVGFTCNYIV